MDESSYHRAPLCATVGPMYCSKDLLVWLERVTEEWEWRSASFCLLSSAHKTVIIQGVAFLSHTFFLTYWHLPRGRLHSLTSTLLRSMHNKVALVLPRRLAPTSCVTFFAVNYGSAALRTCSNVGTYCMMSRFCL
jgi:hypothetical protein